MKSDESTHALMNSSTGDGPVAIRLYSRTIDAALDLATLESHGITAHITGDHVGDALSWYGLAVQKVELIVPQRKVEEAKRILAEQSASRSENQRPDWVCAECNEVNGREFDFCWSCGKTWSQDADSVSIPQNPAQPLPTENDPLHFLPETNPNPYAPPVAGTVVKCAAGVEIETEIRRATLSLIFSIGCPPLVLYAFFLGAQTLSRVARNELPASSRQCWRLRGIMIAAVLMLPMCLVFFPVIL